MHKKGENKMFRFTAAEPSTPDARLLTTHTENSCWSNEYPPAPHTSTAASTTTAAVPKTPATPAARAPLATAPVPPTAAALSFATALPAPSVSDLAFPAAAPAPAGAPFGLEFANQKSRIAFWLGGIRTPSSIDRTPLLLLVAWLGRAMVKPPTRMPWGALGSRVTSSSSPPLFGLVWGVLG